MKLKHSYFLTIKHINMPAVIIRHKVGDFDTWLKGHQDREEIFGKVTSGFEEFRDTDDPNSVVIVLQVTDMDKMNAMMQDPEVQKKKDAHTVIDPLIISMPV
jgi:hypothetical protein